MVAATPDYPSWLEAWERIGTGAPYAYVENRAGGVKVVIGGGLKEKGIKGLREAALLLHTAAELLEDEAG